MKARVTPEASHQPHVTASELRGISLNDIVRSSKPCDPGIAQVVAAALEIPVGELSCYIQILNEKRLRSRFIYFIQRNSSHSDLSIIPASNLYRVEFKCMHVIGYSTHLFIIE